MSLFSDTVVYLRKDELIIYYIIICLIKDIIIPLITSKLMLDIIDEKDKLPDLLPYLLLLRIFTPLLQRFVISNIENKIIFNMSNRFTTDKYNMYDSFSYESKIKTNHQKFRDLYQQAKNSLQTMISWGLHSILLMISVICELIITFTKKNLLHYLFLLCLVFGLFYYFHIISKQSFHTRNNARLRKNKSNVECKIALDGIPFQYKEITSDEMIDHENNITKFLQEMDIMWSIIINDVVLFLSVINIIVIYYSSFDVKTFLLVSMMLSKFDSSCRQVIQFKTIFNRINNEYNSFIDMINESTIKEEPVKKYLRSAKNLKIKSVNIPLGDNFTVKFSKQIKHILIKNESKILITGPSGCGKSSFVKALFGLLDKATVKLTHGSGQNYYHAVADYFQEIKEKMPSSSVSIRDYFRKEQDDDIIKKYLLFGWTNDELDRIFQSIKLSNMNDQDINILDMKINEKLSGGQKSRLIFWQRAYITDKYNKDIIVLDEPMPDVDHDSYKDNIIRFFERYHNKMIIMIAHPCECKKEFLYPMMTDKLVINNKGMINYC